MKFQDDISNMNTYIRTYIHTDKPKPICPLLFQSWGHKNWGGGGGVGLGGQGRCERRIEVFVKIQKKKNWGGGGRGGGGEGSDWGGGARVDVNEELKFL